MRIFDFISNALDVHRVPTEVINSEKLEKIKF
jgi:hypothetical protein